jgi:hypothetical protein
MADSTLTLTFTQATKKVVPVGTVAVREESIDLVVVGGGALVADGLVLKVQDMYDNGASTPIGITTAFTAVGADAHGTLNLNTTEAIAAFANVANLAFKAFNILLYTTTSNALHCNGVLSVMNFPSVSAGEPVTIGEAATLAELTVRVESLEASIGGSVLYTAFAAVDPIGASYTNAEMKAKINELITLLKG